MDGTENWKDIRPSRPVAALGAAEHISEPLHRDVEGTEL